MEEKAIPASPVSVITPTTLEECKRWCLADMLCLSFAFSEQGDCEARFNASNPSARVETRAESLSFRVTNSKRK